MMYNAHWIGWAVLFIAFIGCGSSKKNADAGADGGDGGKETSQGDAGVADDKGTGNDTGASDAAEEAPARCGNGEVEGLEECDDGDSNDTNGCTSYCEFSCHKDADCQGDFCSGSGVRCSRTTHTCTAGSGPKPDGTMCGDDASCYQGKCVVHACNNGIVEDDEECDDGNASDTDGCTTQCKFPCLPGSENYPECASGADVCHLYGTCDAGGGETDGGTAAEDGGGQGDAGGVDDFDKCIATLQECDVMKMDTAQSIQTPCSSLKYITVPLTTGGSYGPMTVPAGPYGGKIEWNQGAGTEFVNTVNVAEVACVPAGIETFAEPASVNAQIENLRDIDWSLYTIVRPACFKKGEKYPVITWANGTCGETAGYGSLLAGVASHGFVIIASNSTWTAATYAQDGKTLVQLRALDYAEALNDDPDSIFYQKLDLDRIGAMGHSQGSMATANASSDPRIKSLILWNGGTSNNKPFLYVSGDRDIGAPTPATLASETDAATQPGAWVFYHQVLETGGTYTGHLVLMEQPDRVVDMAIAWWKWQLKGDGEAKKMFVGDDCGLCNHADEYEYDHNSLLK